MMSGGQPSDIMEEKSIPLKKRPRDSDEDSNESSQSKKAKSEDEVADAVGDKTSLKNIIFESSAVGDRARRWTVTLKGIHEIEDYYDELIKCDYSPEWLLDLDIALHDKDEGTGAPHIHIGAAFNTQKQLGAFLKAIIPELNKPKKIWAEPMKSRVAAHSQYIKRGAMKGKYILLKSSCRKDSTRGGEAVNYIHLAEEFLDSKMEWDDWRYDKTLEDSKMHFEMKHIRENVELLMRRRTRDQCNLTRTLRDKQLYPWQEHLKEILDGPINDRDIIAVVDPVGNSGKSSYARKYLYEHPGECVIVQNGKTQDLARILSKEDPLRLRVVFMDFSRTNQDYINFEIIEKIKNGHMSSTKYDSTTINLANHPHIVLLTNQHLDYTKMSDDRWKVYEIGQSFYDKSKYSWKKLTLDHAKTGYEDTSKELSARKRMLTGNDDYMK